MIENGIIELYSEKYNIENQEVSVRQLNQYNLKEKDGKILKRNE